MTLHRVRAINRLRPTCVDANRDHAIGGATRLAFVVKYLPTLRFCGRRVAPVAPRACLHSVRPPRIHANGDGAIRGATPLAFVVEFFPALRVWGRPGAAPSPLRARSFRLELLS